MSSQAEIYSQESYRDCDNSDPSQISIDSCDSLSSLESSGEECTPGSSLSLQSADSGKYIVI